MNKALQRLSTGYRINSSKDDAAGLAISTNLDYKTSSYKVAKNNTQMGQSMLETASGSLSNIKNMLQRMRDLAEQSANGTYGEDERKAMQTEVDALTDEIFRIKNTTEFNGRKILGEEEQTYTAPTVSMSEITDLSKVDKSEIIGISSALELKNLASMLNSDETLSVGRTFVLTNDIDLNELGNLDGNGSNWNPIKNFYGIFDGNDNKIENLKLNSSTASQQGFFKSSSGTLKNINLENANIVGNSDVGALVGQSSAKIENCHANGSVKGNGQVGGLVGYSNSNEIKNSSFIGDVKGTQHVGGLLGANRGKITSCYTSGTVSGQVNTGGLLGADFGSSNSFISDSKTTVKLLQKGCALIGASSNRNNLSNNEYNSSINGESVQPIGLPYTDEQIKDNKNLVIDDKIEKIEIKTSLQVGINNDKNSVIDVDTGFSLGVFNVLLKNDDTSRKSLDKIDAMIAKVTNKMTEIGAVQNRLESSMEFQDTHITALTASNSLIKDADIAEESSNYIRSQILQQTTSTLLATANQAPSIALQLI